jgi:hypothetical protein
MKYRFVSIYPADGFDSVITFYATPNWLERQWGVRARTVRYYGSGRNWREEGEDGPRCGWLASDWLHEIWNEHWDSQKGGLQERELDNPA